MSRTPRRSVDADGSEVWWLDNKLHREDGPAVIDADGNQGWYYENVLHRDDGPAWIGVTGARSWFRHGRRHRGDGPAIIPPRQPPEWWINGRNLTEEINAWMAARGVSLPFDEETQAEFILTFWECYQVNA